MFTWSYLVFLLFNFLLNNFISDRDKNARLYTDFMTLGGKVNGQWLFEPAAVAEWKARLRPAGVAPEVNLRNPLRTGGKARKRGIHPSYQKTQGRRHQKSKTGISRPTKKTCVLQKILKKGLWLKNSEEL